MISFIIVGVSPSGGVLNTLVGTSAAHFFPRSESHDEDDSHKVNKLLI